MKKITTVAATLFMLVACNKDLSKLNVDTKNPSSVPSYTLFSNAQKNFANIVADVNPNNNIFRLITQQWTQTTYTDESNYDLNTRAIPDTWWAIFYRDCLRDWEEAKKLIPTDVLDEGQQKNELAITDIMEVHAFYILVNTFGDIPYTKALDPTILFPPYDDAKTIYYDLLTRLDNDMANLDESAASFNGADLIYAGDVSKWKKYANSLKLVMGMQLSDSDPEKAKSVVESAAPGVFSSNDDNAIFHFLAAPPNTNPVWVNLIQSGRNDFVPASTIVNLLQQLNDPRLPLYFTTDPDGGYSGGEPGSGNTFANFSHVADAQTAPDAPYTLLDYAFIQLTLAEAVERGMSVGGTAESHYNAGVTASVEVWGGTEADATTYIAQPSVAYSTAEGDYKEKIARQEYIALYSRGFDSWTTIRRLDYPELPEPVNAQSAFPVRFTYPILEQNINTSNYNTASAAIGGDVVTTRLFWDTH
ncbi:MAG TPA: SusD/RagB family nutrient-binding outer membrane lipoprotein [Panacibacter sp.]|nr:SusD/RagB family nutrient-binding outer membrane lipoprotein [Panacibacter sp.]HNP44158.1 SusD/RagB family nutrient-binding outer membrane lipoprotein [Panacibacter sp.]